MSFLTITHPLILASGSEIRRKMLKDVGLEASVIKPEVDEDAVRDLHHGMPYPELALELARAKAAAVSVQRPNALVLAADQICVLCHGEPRETSHVNKGDSSTSAQNDTAILTKPLTHENAVRQLQLMRGKTHHQHSAAALYLAGKEIYNVVETASLTMRQLSDAEIEHYLKTDMPYHSCGSYKYESYGKHLFSKVEGADAVIYGLPIQPLLAFLYASGYVRMNG